MADEGKNKAAKSLLDLQPTAILELFKVYPDYENVPEKFFTLHGGSNFSNNIIWQGLEYIATPIETEGFGVFADGTLPRPKITLANTHKLISVLLDKFDDFKNGAVLRKKVFLKHLDDANFDGGNPFSTADPNAEISSEKYFFGQKKIENNHLVTFELNSPLDLDNFQVNERTISAKYCHWKYRGFGCRYSGPPVERDSGDPFEDENEDTVQPNATDEFESETEEYRPNKQYVKRDIVKINNPKIILGRSDDGTPIFHTAYYVCVKDHGSDSSTDDSHHPDIDGTYWQKDGCAKQLVSCQKRFANGSSFFKRFYYGDLGGSHFKVLQNKEFNPLSFMTKDSTLTDVLGYTNSDNFTLSITFAGDSFRDRHYNYHMSLLLNSFLVKTNQSNVPPVDETLFATTKVDRDSRNIIVGSYGQTFSDAAMAARENLTGFHVSVQLEEIDLAGLMNGGDTLPNIEDTEAHLNFTNKNNDTPPPGWVLAMENQGYTLPPSIQKCMSRAVVSDGSRFQTFIMRPDPENPNKFEPIVNPNLGTNGELLGVNSRDNVDPSHFSKNQPTSEADFFSLFGDSTTIVSDQPDEDEDQFGPQSRISSFQGSIAQVVIWNRRLTDNEIIAFSEVNVTSDKVIGLDPGFTKIKRVPLAYSQINNQEATESLTNGLIAWYDMKTGFLDPSETVTGILDEHTNNIHLTGYGGSDFEVKEIPYTPANISPLKFNEDLNYHLPFGGFPGTDGYDYGAKN